MANGASGDWRHGSGGSRRPASAPTSRRSWQPGTPPEPKTPGRKKSRAGRFVLAAAGVGVLVGLIVVVIGLLSPLRPPALLVVAPSAPASLALPDNTAGGNAAASLAEWANGGKDRPHLAAPPADLTTADAWATKLTASAGGRWFSKPSPVVLYFAAHGGADRDGPFLWMLPPTDPAPAESHKLRVKSILARLEGLPREQPKLLVFDATRMPASWPHGMLFNDFARGLKELEPDIAKIDGLAVICSSAEDQRSWVSEEWRESAFAYYFREGLRGAGVKPGDRLTAADLFKYVADQTARWSLANRDEKQTPVLLPETGGADRAAQIALATIPPGEYKPPPVADPPAVPADLEAAWKTAWELANRNPPPDTLDPIRWRDYLALLGRWTELARLGVDGGTVKGRVGVLTGQLADVLGKLPVCAAASVPGERVFGLPPAELEPADFRRLWSPPPGSTHAEQWARLTARPGVSEQSLRVTAARQVVDAVKDDPSPASLKTADAILTVIAGDRARLLPTEAHFVRMLNRHLDPVGRPDAALLTAAIDLRRYAEEVAWVGGAKPGEHPYSEHVFRWIREKVEAGDDARARGQDLLFDSDPRAKSWAEARGYFDTARTHYDAARDDARTVAAAVATKDRVFARLPYYARWAAGSHGKFTPADVEALLAQVETVAREAHAISKLTADGPPAGDERSAKLAALAGHTRAATAAFAAVVKAFDTSAAGLTNEPHPSNWRAIDNALSVPFLPAAERTRLFRHARDVAHVLATTSEQKSGAAAPPPPARETARRQGRMALAVLGDGNPELRQLVHPPEEGAWWKPLREAGSRIGEQYQRLPVLARETAKKAGFPTPIADAGPPLAAAADLAREVDPAAPLNPADEPPTAAELRYSRHALLLWQAKRIVTEGWAEVGSRSTAPEWYCKRVADQLIATAEELVIGPDAKDRLSSEELGRRLALCRAARDREPVALEIRSAPDVDVADDPEWRFSFEIALRTRGPVGFPVYWLKPPGEPYALPEPAHAARAAARGLADADTAAVRSPTRRFRPAARPGERVKPGELVATVLYRGQQYERPTHVHLAGTPTLDWNSNPPAANEPAAFSATADKAAVAGSVTILLDVTKSMRQKAGATGKTKFAVACEALDKVLAGLPAKTAVTIIPFWGDAARMTFSADPYPGLTQVDWDGTAAQRDKVMTAVRGFKVDGDSTPIARSVLKVLGRADEGLYWKPDASGVRNLVVLTDGEDNWDADAGKLVLDALLREDGPDTALHLFFFPIEGEEFARAQAQFNVLTRDAIRFKPGVRTAPDLHWNQDDADALADKLRGAVLPRVHYRREETAGGRQAGWVTVALDREQTFKPTPPLEAGAYHLWGLRNLQRLHLDPGDRVLLEALPSGPGKFELAVPPTGYRVARLFGRPVETAGDPRAGGTHLAVQEVRPFEQTGSYDLRLTATMDPARYEPLALLQVPRPLFAWFDVEYADGKPAADGLYPTLRVANRPGLLAPAWDLRLLRWDHRLTRDENRTPRVTGYWVADPPPVAARHTVDLKTLDPNAAGPVRVSIEHVGAGESSLPKGEYLTVRMSYPTRADRVFVRAENLKGTAQRLVLHERHLYFDGPDRAGRPCLYTARFGPLDPADKAGKVDLEVYAVAAFQEQAAKSGRRVAVTVPRVGKDEVVLPDRLELHPAAK